MTSRTIDPSVLRSVRQSMAQRASENPFRGPHAHGGVLPDALSHYTNAGGALGIVKGQEFWASHALFMNDAMELKLARPILEKAFDEIVPTAVGDADLRPRLADAFWTAYDLAETDPGIYVVCFSSHADQLGQWRGYGFDGGGYSLNFAAKDLEALTVGRQNLELVEVLYDVERQNSIASDVVRAFCRIVDSNVAKRPAHDPQEIIDIVGLVGAELAQSLAYRFKDAAFAEEDEWRMIYRRDPYDDAAIAREFRVASERLRPFVRIPTAAPDDSALTPVCVRVGPTAQPELAELSMQYLLDDAGLSDVEIAHSTITLRA